MQLQLLPAWHTSGGHDCCRQDGSTFAASAQQPYNHGLSWHGSSVVQPGNKTLYILQWTGRSASCSANFQSFCTQAQESVCIQEASAALCCG